MIEGKENMFYRSISTRDHSGNCILYRIRGFGSLNYSTVLKFDEQLGGAAVLPRRPSYFIWIRQFFEIYKMVLQDFSRQCLNCPEIDTGGLSQYNWSHFNKVKYNKHYFERGTCNFTTYLNFWNYTETTPCITPADDHCSAYCIWKKNTPIVTEQHCWCPGSLHPQVLNRHNISYMISRA